MEVEEEHSLIVAVLEQDKDVQETERHMGERVALGRSSRSRRSSTEVGGDRNPSHQVACGWEQRIQPDGWMQRREVGRIWSPVSHEVRGGRRGGRAAVVGLAAAT